jgi:acetate kinase
MTGRIAVINAGSSSIKFAICQASRNVDILFRGQIEDWRRAAPQGQKRPRCNRRRMHMAGRRFRP